MSTVTPQIANENNELEKISRDNPVPIMGEALGQVSDEAVIDPKEEANIIGALKGILATLLALLEKTGEIDITADTINLSTDGLETLLGDLKTLIGTVAESPTQYTLLARLKELLTGIVLATGNNLIGKVDVASSALPTGAATEAKQTSLEAKIDIIDTVLDSIAGKDFATQTTLASVLAKLIAAPATEAKQDTLIAKDFATQTTLAAILAKLIAAPATETKQDNLITLLGALNAVAVTDPAEEGSGLSLLKGLLKQMQGNGTGSQPVSISQTEGENVVVNVNLDIALSALRDAIVKTGLTSTTLTDLAALFGEVQESPTPNTGLDRLKSIYTELVAIANSKTLDDLNTTIAGLEGAGNKTLSDIVTAITTMAGSKALSDIVTALGGTLNTSANGTLTTASDTITITTGAAHSANDVVSTDAGEILQFETGLAAGTGGIILDSLVTLDQNAVFAGGAGYTLYLFNVSPTAQATNAAFDLDSLTGYVGKIIISTLVDRGSNCEAEDVGHNKSFTLAAADTKLYGKLVCTGAETTITGKILTINLNIVSA